MKKIFTILLSFVLCSSILTACVKGSENTTSGGENVSSEEYVDPTPEPTPVYDPAFLTGLPKDENYNNNSRVISIMINNISAARPQRGISQADVLVESKVEGGITRFMALFQDYSQVDGDIGPVRSGRDQFLQLAMPLDAVYLHIGRSGVTQTYIDTYEYNDSDVDGQYKIFTEYDQNRINRGYSREHTAFTNAEKLTSVMEKNEVITERTYRSPWLYFANYIEYENGTREMQGESANEVSITHSNSYRTYFDFDEASGNYMMSMYNSKKGVTEATIDENNNEQLSFRNVLVLFADITTYYYPGGNLDKDGNDKGNPNYQKVDYLSGGFGYYFSNGRVERITWQKGEAVSFLKLYNEEGNSLMLNCGKTYVGIVDYDEYDRFSYAGDEEEIIEEEIIDDGSGEVETGEDVADYETNDDIKG